MYHSGIYLNHMNEYNLNPRRILPYSVEVRANNFNPILNTPKGYIDLNCQNPIYEEEIESVEKLLEIIKYYADTEHLILVGATDRETLVQAFLYEHMFIITFDEFLNPVFKYDNSIENEFLYLDKTKGESEIFSIQLQVCIKSIVNNFIKTEQLFKENSVGTARTKFHKFPVYVIKLQK